MLVAFRPRASQRGAVLLVTLCLCAAPALGQTPAPADGPVAPPVSTPTAPPAGGDVSPQQLIAAGRFAEAEVLLAAAVAANPQAGGAWFRLGYARHAQGKLDAALEAHLRAAGFPAFRSQALYNAGCAQALLGRKEEALASLAQAIAAGFADRGLLASDADLASLREDGRFAALLPPLLEGPALFAEPARVLHTFAGESAGSEFGWIARRLADLDADGVADFVTTAPGFRGSTGKVYVHSGRTGALLFSRVGQPGQRLGNAAADAGDVDADGLGDVIVGAPGGDLAEVLSGRDGSLLLTLRGDLPGAGFGYAVCGLGDVDGDGHADLAVTSLPVDGSATARGRCQGFSGQDGRPLFVLDGTSADDKLGSAVAACTRVSPTLLALGAPGAGPGGRGRVHLYRLAATGLQLGFTLDGGPSAVDFGQMFLSFPGDLDGDGVPDLYTSDFNDSGAAPGAGRVRLHSGADGHLLYELTGDLAGAGLGTSPSDAGDLDGDGVGDLAIGAWQHGGGGASAGRVTLHSGADGRLLWTWTCLQAGDTFGFDATGLGDVDGDGRGDLLLTSAWSAPQGPRSGRVFILAGPELPAREPGR